MHIRVSAMDLLAQAAVLYDAAESPLRRTAFSAAWGGFTSGAGWMRLALETIPRISCLSTEVSFQRLGLIKYGLAVWTALIWAFAAWVFGFPWLVPLSVLVFYAVEAQMVFLFPVAIDGGMKPFSEAWLWTKRAGGTISVMRVVLPLAFTMLLGGFAGRGFIRSWCLGCLAVCLWYVKLRAGTQSDKWSCSALTAQIKPGFILEVGCFRPLFIRREQVHLGLDRPVRVLYASDLHLGWWWTGDVPRQLKQAAQQSLPDLILLGGDLTDARKALPILGRCVRTLVQFAPVLAIPGNHDVAEVGDAIRSAGGHWLLDHSFDHGVRIDGMVNTRPSARPRLLCAHHPNVFPAAVKAHYGIVLAGHLHGGQCVFATRQGRLYPAAWFCGWHGLRFADQGSMMFVSRGVADTLPIRFNCPREVILCEIT